MLHWTDLALRSETGPRRQNNEDAAAALESPMTVVGVDGIYVVADGLGGHDNGEIASAMAVETVLSAFRAETGASDPTTPLETRLGEAIRRANDRIYRVGMTGASLHMNPERPGMGTTLTALVLAGDRAVIGHVGDSRAYLLRGGVLTQITEDHTVVAERVRQGRLAPDAAWESGLRNVLTQAVGTGEDVTLFLLTVTALTGDVFLLCTDGLWDALGDKRMQDILTRKDDSRGAAEDLVEEALRVDGSDNTTALVLRLR